MCYPTNGKNHHKAVNDEKNISLNSEIFEKHYGKKVKKITHIGGTKTKTDILIEFEDGSKINASLKSKNSIRKGSFDWVNSSDFGNVESFFEKTLQIYEKYKNSRRTDVYPILINQISEDLNSINFELTKLFQERVINKYENLSLIIFDKKENKMYFDVKPRIFDFVKNDQNELEAFLIGDIIYTMKDGKMEQEVINIRKIPCDLALIAAGFLHTDHTGLFEQLIAVGVTADERGNLVANSSYQSENEKVFIAGDARRGQSLVVWAISEGREAARNIDLFLMGKTSLEGKTISSFDVLAK